ncbi:dihydroneopterin aldolase [Paracoccus zhejiangensis]|uniref:Dihydroneopterin aldolase n=1 Tax=Paracoccus zhejiangensis TaxID=1077935 RepID=A0A2H5EWS6_9RHOB|nr:dihydroneopterin aldolase [Paracoccus zhejiangensis]AUH63768.1 dihydroneopterin aldolase [Paracoccus zhejiangensis]
MDHPDRLHLRDYLVSADIGAFQSERGQTQRLRFNLTVELGQPVSGAGDQVDEILSYDVLTDAVAAGLSDRRYNLLETLAEKIAAEALAHPRAAKIDVTIEKLDRVPGALGLSITRQKGRVAAEPTALRPVVIHLGTDRSLAPPAGAVIVPAAPGLPLPATGDPRRIALLALDQAAWALAGRLGLDVSDSRTEMDWSIANGLPTVWAPYRMVADEIALDADPLALSLWLAGRLNAERLDLALADGAPLPDAPAGSDLIISRLP